ncbi:MAG: transglycosylase domain-containing protein [Ferrimicrobium sp.]
MTVGFLRHMARLGALGMILAAVGLVGALVLQNFAVLKEPGSLSTPIAFRPLAVSSVIESANGQPLYTIGTAPDRSIVTLAQVPSTVVHAVIDVEDHTYYSHGALDIRSIARALAADVSGGQILEGGSTITQQLVKNAILSPQRTIARKLREAILAYRIEGQMSKQAILARYLNTIYFGEGAYGIAAAARIYFGLSLKALNPAQAALLASLIEDPSGLNPFIHPRAALVRRNIALQQMAQYGDLSAKALKTYEAFPLPKTPDLPATQPPSGYVNAVLIQLETAPQYAFLGSTPSERYGALLGGGYRIVTAMNPTDQAAAHAAVAARLPSTGGRFTAALVSVDPANGNVVALISGNPQQGIGGYNVATGFDGTGRQPGSGFKIFTLLTALEKGYSPLDTVDGTSPCTFTVPHTVPFPYVAHNAEPGFGLVSVQKATADSINCAYIRIGVTVGLPAVVTTARLMGITTKLAAIPSMVIGSEDVYPIQMAAAYAAVADYGIYHRPRFVLSVESLNGKSLYQSVDPGRRVVSSQVAKLAIYIFRQTIAYGTGTGAAIGRPAAGKTGTTDNFVDGWFNGFVPQLETTVWMGDPQGSVPMYVNGAPVYGGTYPASIWQYYNEQVLANVPTVPFEAPNLAVVAPPHVIVPIDAPGSITAVTPPTSVTTTTTTSVTTTTTSVTTPAATSTPSSSPTTPTTTG